MNISPISFNCTNSFQRKSSKRINFGCNKTIPLKEVPNISLLKENEIVDNIFKLVKKIQFISKIIGEHDKTAKPVLAKIDDAPIYISMDKNYKDKIKINLFSDTDEAMYKYSSELEKYVPVETPELIRQSLDMIVSKKDKRMINGQLDIFGCNINFARDTKNGRREFNSNKCFYFVPNLYECNNIEDVNVQFYQNTKATNIVTSTFFNLFANLTKVKPDITLIK